MSSSDHRQQKRFKTSSTNALSNITSFGQLGLSLYDPGDNVIETEGSYSADGRRFTTQHVVAPAVQPRVYTEVNSAYDWSDFNIYTEDDLFFPSQRQNRQETTLFQVKNGQVIKVKQRRLYASVSDSIIMELLLIPGLSQDHPMQTFIRHREEYLKVMMILKGRGDKFPVTCPTCPSERPPESPQFRCLDCSQGLTCQDCCVRGHKDNPLHRIQVSYIVTHQHLRFDTFAKALEWPLF
jgi:hypothetical protein